MPPHATETHATEISDTTAPDLRSALLRACRNRCPGCGEGRLFRRYNTLHETCDACGCDFLGREPDCWGVLYFSMAGIFGVFVVLMLIAPLDVPLLRFGLPVLCAATILGSLPFRKGVALAIDIYFDREETRRRKRAGEDAGTLRPTE